MTRQLSLDLNHMEDRSCYKNKALNIKSRHPDSKKILIKASSWMSETMSKKLVSINS